MAWEAYSVAVKISLINNVSSGLMALSRHFNSADKDAKQLQSTINKIKTAGLVSAAVGGLGFMGLGIFSKVLKPAEEYVHQLNIMNMAGMKQAEIADSVGAAWKTSKDIITTSATENLRTILDLRNILGDMQEAKMALPIVARAQAVFGSSTSKSIASNSQEFAYGMAKALDIIGAAQNKSRFEHETELMSKAIIATQGRVTPMSFQSVFQYARQAKYGWSDEFKYEFIPTLIQEYAAGKGSAGGGSRGVGPMLSAFYRWAIQGYINQKALPELKTLGLIDASTALKTTTSGTTVGAMRNWQLAQQNPFLWVQQVLVPAIKGKYGENISQQDLQFRINQIARGNQLAAALATEFAFKPINFIRDQKNIQRTMSTAEAYKAAMGNDPDFARRALGEQWTNLKTSLMMTVVPILVPGLIKLSEGLNVLSAAAKNHPLITKTLVIMAGGVATILAVGGAIATATFALKGLGLVLPVIKTLSLALAGPKGLTIAAGAASVGIGYLIGTLLNNKINHWTKTLTEGKNDTFGAWLWEFTHPDKVNPVQLNAVHPRQNIPQHSHNAILQVDSRVLGQVTLKEIVKEGSGPVKGISDFDWTMQAVPIGVK